MVQFPILLSAILVNTSSILLVKVGFRIQSRSYSIVGTSLVLFVFLIASSILLALCLVPCYTKHILEYQYIY